MVDGLCIIYKKVLNIIDIPGTDLNGHICIEVTFHSGLQGLI